MAINSELIRRLGIIRQDMMKHPFIVLIWGPGVTSNTPPGLKRQRLREYMEGIVGNENVIFSEDPEVKGLFEEGEFTAEFMQGLAADAIILIPESPGSITEGALYNHEIQGKTIVFSERRTEQGFAQHAYGQLKVEEIEPEEWSDCNHVRAKARDFVENLRVSKYRQVRKTRFDWE